jgi:Zn-dependent peptidase ImmA (M78 family)
MAHILLHPLKKPDRAALETEEAEIFASRFLMPDEAFKLCWGRTGQQHWTERVIKIKRIFSIPCPEILLRLQSLSGREYAQLERNFLKHFNGSLDPYSQRTEINLEERFVYLVSLSLYKRYITPQTAAKILEVPEEVVKRLAEDIEYLAEI